MSNDTSARLAAIKEIPTPRLLALAQAEAAGRVRIETSTVAQRRRAIPNDTMSIEEAIERLEHLVETYCAGAAGTRVERGWVEAAKVAVSLLRTHPDAQPNEPLTAQELQGMVGQQVYYPDTKRWVVVDNIVIQAVFCDGAKVYCRPPKEA